MQTQFRFECMHFQTAVWRKTYREEQVGRRPKIGALKDAICQPLLCFAIGWFKFIESLKFDGPCQFTTLTRCCNQEESVRPLCSRSEHLRPKCKWLVPLTITNAICVYTKSPLAKSEHWSAGAWIWHFDFKDSLAQARQRGLICHFAVVSIEVMYVKLVAFLESFAKHLQV